MAISYREESLKEDIRNKNYNNLKVTVVSTLLNDPDGTLGETEELIERLKQEVPEIFETESRLGYEERLDDQEKWDKIYYAKLAYWFRDNFAESRLPYIREVGKYISGKGGTAQSKEASHITATQRKAIISEPTTGNRTDGGKKQTKPNFPIAGVIAVLVALAVLIMIIASIAAQKQKADPQLTANSPQHSTSQSE